MVSQLFKNKRKNSERPVAAKSRRRRDEDGRSDSESRSNSDRPRRSNRKQTESNFIPEAGRRLKKRRFSEEESSSDRPKRHRGNGKSRYKGGSSRPRSGDRRRSNGSNRNNGSASFQPKRVENFDPAKYANTPQPEGAFTVLMPPIQNALTVQGYVTPTPIQARAIPEILQGRDVLGSAQTGTGKTAAFVLPLLDLICNGTVRERELGVPTQYERPQANKPKALILAPTRELADQIGQSIEGYSAFLRVSHTVVYGGVSQHHQVRALDHGVDILVATPGRLLDLMKQGHIDLSIIEYFILDEVDRMLDMGFIPDIRKILDIVPADRQTLFFSATLSRKVLEVAVDMVRNPVEIIIEPEQVAVEKIRQLVYFVDEKNKKDLLGHVLEKSENPKAMVFTQMKHAANKLAESLEKSGIRATAIHGNKSQSARTKALQGFKEGRFQVLVATDVAARGIDIDDVTHVINYDMPMEAETYVHRIGRTARAGSDGDAISFCSAPERALLYGVEKHLNIQVPVDRDHHYHCEKAATSRMAAPKLGGSRNRGQGRGRRGHGGRSRRRD
jgi:ATP-dependent RNA helicase RhlE